MPIEMQSLSIITVYWHMIMLSVRRLYWCRRVRRRIEKYQWHLSLTIGLGAMQWLMWGERTARYICTTTVARSTLYMYYCSNMQHAMHAHYSYTQHAIHAPLQKHAVRYTCTTMAPQYTHRPSICLALSLTKISQLEKTDQVQKTPSIANEVDVTKAVELFLTKCTILSVELFFTKCTILYELIYFVITITWQAICEP